MAGFPHGSRKETPGDKTGDRPLGSATPRWQVAMLTASSTGWVFGIAVGVVVIAIAAVLVIAIVLLALKIARQAKTAEQAVEVVRQQTSELPGIGRINDSGVRILHAARSLRKVAVGK